MFETLRKQTDSALQWSAVRLAVCLVLSLAIGCLPVLAAPPTTAPVPMWGELLGAAPASLSALLRTGNGDLVARSRARLSRDSGRLYYALQWPGDVARPASRRPAGLTLGFELDGKETPHRLVLQRGRPLPERVNLRDGAPELPALRLLVARAELAIDGEITFTARLASSVQRPLSGTLSWHPQTGQATGPSAGLALAARAQAVSRLKYRPPDLATLAPIWAVSWEDPDRAEPRLTARVRVVRNRNVIARADGGAGRLLAGGPGMKREGLPRISFDSLPLSRGQYLEVDLEVKADDADTALAAIQSLSVGEPRRKPARAPEFPLSEAQVAELPGGSLWLHASWLVPDDRTMAGLQFHSTGDASLPGTWTLHYLGSQDLFTPAKSY